MSKKANLKKLPPTLQRFIKAYPQVWTAHERLGVECANAGPLSEKEIQFVKLAITGSLMLETAFKTHVRKAVRVGVTQKEIEHAILLLLPIVGMGRTIMGMKWYQEALNRK